MTSTLYQLLNQDIEINEQNKDIILNAPDDTIKQLYRQDPHAGMSRSKIIRQTRIRQLNKMRLYSTELNDKLTLIFPDHPKLLIK